MGPNLKACVVEIEKIGAVLPGGSIIGRAGKQVLHSMRVGLGADAQTLRQGMLPKALLGLTALQTAQQLPGALRKEDPSGQHLSRGQRLGGLVGSLGGGALAAGSLMRAQAAPQARIAAIRGAARQAFLRGAPEAELSRLRFLGKNIPLASRIGAHAGWVLPMSILGSTLGARALMSPFKPQPAPSPQPVANPQPQMETY